MITAIPAGKFANSIMVKNRHYGSKECDNCPYVKKGDCPIKCRIVNEKLIEELTKKN
jgi:hypothetical protein